MKRVVANNPGAIYMLAQHYCNGERGLLARSCKGNRALYQGRVDLGSSQAHFHLCNINDVLEIVRCLRIDADDNDVYLTKLRWCTKE